MARLLKNWIKSYIEYTRHSESPETFHFWTAVSTIGGALRRRVWINQLYFQWTPNFYIVMVGPAGVAAKSTSANIGLEILREIDVSIGPQSITWQALIQSLTNSKQLVLTDPSDPLSESLPMCCITCSISELGTFLNPRDEEMVSVLTSLWDGQKGVWERATKTQGNNSIENPWINIIACTTPSWLNNNFTESMIGGGLTSRIIFVFGDEKRQLVTYPADLINPADFEEKKEALIHDLGEIAHILGEMYLSPEAKAWGYEWYTEHWSSRPLHLADPRYDGYIARKQGHIHKLAMVLSAARSDDLEITLDDLQMANSFTTHIEHDMRKVFRSIGIRVESRSTSDILSLLHALGPTTQKDLWRHCMMTMQRREFLDAISGAREAGYVLYHGGAYLLTPDGERQMKG